MPERLASWVWVLGYTAFLSSATVLRYHLWLATGYDLGLMEQALWLIWHGGLGAVSTYTNTPVGTIGGAYMLLLLVPFYAIGGVGLLLVLQSFALGLGYLIIRRIGAASGASERWSHLVGVAYLLYPTVLGANLFDFHPEALAVPLLLAAVWAAVARRWLPFTACVAGALLAGGSAALVVAGLGVTLLLRRQWRLGFLSLLLAGVTWRLGGPALTSGGVALSGALRVTGGAPATAASLLNWALRLRSWEYLAWLFGPLAGAAAVMRRRALNAWWFPGLLLIVTNLLAPGSAGTSPFTQQSLLAVPFWFAALIPRRQNSVAQKATYDRALALAVVPPLVVLTALMWHEVHVGVRLAPRNASALYAAVALVPTNVPVVAQNVVLPALSDRREVWLPNAALTSGLPSGTFILLDRGATAGLTPAGDMARLRGALDAKGQATVLSSVATPSGSVTVWRLNLPLRALGLGGGT